MRHHPVRIGAPRDIVPPLSPRRRHAAGAAAEKRRRLRRSHGRSPAHQLDGRGALKDEARRRRGTRRRCSSCSSRCSGSSTSPLIEAWCDTAGHAAHRSGQSRFRRPRAAADRGAMRPAQLPRRLGQEQRPAARMGARAADAEQCGHRSPRNGWLQRPISPSIDRALTRFAARARGCAARRARRAAVHGAARRLRRGEEDAVLRAGADLERRDRRRAGRSRAGARRPISGPGRRPSPAHLVDPLRGQPMTFVLGGETMHPDWFEAVEMPGADPPTGPADQPLDHAPHDERRARHEAVHPAPPPARERVRRVRRHAGRPRRVRRARSDPAAAACCGHSRPPRTVTAGSFLALASRVLLERDPARNGARDAGVVAGARRRPRARGWPTLLSRAVAKRFADTKRQPGRFDEPGARYVRSAPSSACKPEGACPARTEWSAYSEPFVIAPWYEGSRRAAGADPAARRHRPQPAAVAQAERRLRAAPGAPEPPPREARKICSRARQSGGGSFTVGWICSFSLPIITICAFICLNIFLSLFDLIFRWMFFIKICIPFPKRSES